MSYFQKHKSKILSALGAILLSSAILVLENTVLAGIFSVLGLLLLLFGGRYAQTRLDIILNGILLWISHSIRFSLLFGSEFIYTIFCILLFIPYCLVIVASLFLDRYFLKINHSFIATLVIPFTYALFSFLTTTLNIGFISNLIGYIMCIPIISTNLSYLGEYILTFILLWIFFCFLSVWFESKKKIKIALGVISLTLSMLLIISGTILYNKWGEPDYTINVALATSQEMEFTGESDTIYTMEEQLTLFSSAIKEAKENGADLLVLNEEYFYFKKENMEFMLESISNIVKSHNIPTLVGMDVISDDELDINEAIYFDQDGTILYTYIKNNLVPFIESGYFVDGIEEPAIIHTTIDGVEINIAFVICYDVNDEVYLRKIPSNTELLIVPSWDWDNCNIEQRRTKVRSSTLGLTMIKHTFEGFSFVSTPNGECTECVDFRHNYEIVKMVSVPIWDK